MIATTHTVPPNVRRLTSSGQTGSAVLIGEEEREAGSWRGGWIVPSIVGRCEQGQESGAAFASTSQASRLISSV
jgi:hypothetical protein